MKSCIICRQSRRMKGKVCFTCRKHMISGVNRWRAIELDRFIGLRMHEYLL